MPSARRRPPPDALDRGAQAGRAPPPSRRPCRRHALKRYDMLPAAMAADLAGSPILDCHTHCWRRWPYAPVPDAASRATDEQPLYETDAGSVSEALVVSASIDDTNADNLGYVAAACARHPDRLRLIGSRGRLSG